MSLFSTCHIVLFALCRVGSKQFDRRHESLKKDQERDKHYIMEADERTGKADVIYMIATHVIFSKIMIYIRRNWTHILYIHAFDTVVY